MAEIAILFVFLLLVVGTVGFGEMLNEKYQWVDTKED